MKELRKRKHGIQAIMVNYYEIVNLQSLLLREWKQIRLDVLMTHHHRLHQHYGDI